MARIDCANVAATIHADMCDDDRNGYSWSPRWGGDHPDGSKTLVIDGLPYTYQLGSYDCSSSIITAWSLALTYTPYAGCLGAAQNTYTMRSVFEGSGLFYTSSDDATRGDVYLNDQEHTAMCQDGGNDSVFGYDALSEFSINENGDVYGGEVGDQTGREAYIHGYYDDGWPGTLHYNGNADGEADTSGSGGSSEDAGDSGNRYQGYTRESGWLEHCTGTRCECTDAGCTDDFCGIEGQWLYGFDANFEFQLTLMDGTLTDWVTHWDDCGQAIRGITIRDAKYQAHFCGVGWGKVEDGDSDGGAGDDVHALDLVRVW